MKIYRVSLLVMFLHMNCVIGMELQQKAPWYTLPDTAIMQVAAILDIENKQALVLVNKQLSELVSKKNIDNLLQFPCVLSRKYHRERMVTYAKNNDEKMMIWAMRSAPLCNHEDGLEIVFPFIPKNYFSMQGVAEYSELEKKDNSLKIILPIIMAVYKGDPTMYCAYKEKFIEDVEKRNKFSVLQLASICNHLAIAELLMEQEKQDIVDFRTRAEGMSDYMPLHIASVKGYLDMIKLLCEHPKTDINAQLDNGCTPLMIALSQRHHECARYLLSKQANNNIPSGDFLTPLYIAAQDGDIVMVELLIAQKAIIDVPAKGNQTPLLIAITCDDGNDGDNRINIVTMLLDAGADPNIQEQQLGLTPLMEAIAKKNYVVAELLLKKGALVNTPRKGGGTALMGAAETDQYDIMELLLNYNADPNKADDDGNVPLHGAVRNSNGEAVALLLDKGAKIDVKNNNGHTPLMVVVNSNNFSVTGNAMQEIEDWEKTGDTFASFIIAELLLGAGANPHAVDTDGDTALKHAVCVNNVAMIDLLLEHGANPLIKNLKGENAFMFTSNKDIVQRLNTARTVKNKTNVL